jgi:hypothetical protein
MNKTYEPIRNVWDFEKYIASKPQVWINEAINLRNAAEVLFLYDKEVFQRIFEEKSSTRLPAFFTARIERMLMGFSLENLIKAILLQTPTKIQEVFVEEGRLSWGKDGHNLLRLFKEAKIEISNLEEKYLAVWQECAIWAGRYPLPVNESGLPLKRKGLPSREALLRRSTKRIKRAIAEGDQLLGAEINDLLHIGVGDIEAMLFRSLFERCKNLLTQKS